MDITVGSFHFHLDWFFLVVSVLLLFVVVPVVFRNRSLKAGLASQDSQGRTVVSYTIGKTPQLPKGKKSIVVIDVRGPILTSGAGLSPLAARYATLGIEMGIMLRDLADNDQVLAAAVRISTPGGTVVGSEELRDGLQAFSKVKPLLVYVEDISASGGVLAMVGATEIMAHPSSLLGSIGVLGPTIKHYDNVTAYGQSMLSEQVTAKVTARVMYAGKGKPLGNPFFHDDSLAVAAFQSVLDESYERFVAGVAQLRRINDMVLRELGACIISGTQARTLGLIDSLGTEEQAMQRICELAGIARDEANLVSIKQKLSSRFSLLFGVIGDLGIIPQARTEVGQQLLSDPVLLCAPNMLHTYGVNR